MAENIITLRNAASNFDSMLEIHRKIFEAFHFNKFDLSSIASFFAEQRLMASNGRVGLEARERAFNENTSLDSMLMQVKAYGEIYRLLGLWRSESDKEKTKYRITFLGELILKSSVGYHKGLLAQCWLGIQLPNFVIEDRDSRNQTRIIWSYLRAIDAMKRPLSKQGLIYICHTLQDDENSDEFNGKVQSLNDLPYTNKAKLKSALEQIAQSALPKPIKTTTLDNSTRLTIAALKQFGWTKGVGNNSYELSEYGKDLVDSYSKYYRPTAQEVMAMSFELRKAISIVGLIQLLDRANIPTHYLRFQLKYNKNRNIIWNNSLFNNEQTEILFSPYQALAPKDLIEIFGDKIENYQNLKPIPLEQKNHSYTANNSDNNTFSTETIVTIEYSSNNQPTHFQANNKILNEFTELYTDKKLGFDKAICRLNDDYSNSKQFEFYEAIAALFRIIGFNAQASRAGQNSSRFDAIITHETQSIPIEIKSPTEERNLSVKGIRQALENKIVIESRKEYASTRETSSFLVGYLYPNERSEVHDLLKYIKNYYGISIAVISFEELMRMAFTKHLNPQAFDEEIIFSLFGIIHTKKLQQVNK